MKILKKLLNKYVISHANSIDIPDFPSSNLVRKKVVFIGEVQNVGFRMEMYTLAQRVNLTGWVKNLPDGNVEAELQGEEAKVDFVIKSMKSLKRANVEECKTLNIHISPREKEFTILW